MLGGLPFGPIVSFPGLRLGEACAKLEVMPQVLLGLEVTEIRELLGPDHPPWRARQVYDAVYRQGATDIAAISTLPATLRRQWRNQFSIGLPELLGRFESSDGTRRYLLGLSDGRSVEAVLMPEGGRDTICISTQVGCPAGCKFCLTALLGLERDLTVQEIVGQALLLARDNRLSPSNRRLNVVMMGMGEPLLNLPNVLKAVRLLTDPKGFGLSPRRITVSTAGITPKIEELGREAIRPKLAVSLNAPTQQQREELMPLARAYPLDALLAACRAYPLRSWEKLTFEYVLLAGINDSDADARRLARLLAPLRCKVNLIPLNPGPGIPYASPAPERVASFQALVRRSVPCFVRATRGRDIFAACGQLKRTPAG